MLDNGHEVHSFEDDEELVDRESIIEIPKDNSITDPEDIEAMGLIIVPLSIDIFAMADVDKSCIIKFTIIPMWCVEGEIIVNEDTKSMPLALCVGLSLILCISVVDVSVHE